MSQRLEFGDLFPDRRESCGLLGDLLAVGRQHLQSQHAVESRGESVVPCKQGISSLLRG